MPMPPIALERIQTDDNTDTLTQATVQKMCALIRDSATDPLVKQCAAYARNRFASGSSDPAAIAWGVFWYVKHCVKFRSDEGTMMQVGEQALDLLTAPAVLVRMKDPSEDCDGFTMLSAAMLTILGVPVLVTTVAVDLDDPRRWSHVFLCAVINGRVMPLDTSHGKAPGWMVPRSRINRWQTWKLDGSPADVQIPAYHGLHGYMPVRRPIPTMRPRLFMTGGRGRGFQGLGQVAPLCATSVCLDNTEGYCTEYDDSSCSVNSLANLPTSTPNPLTSFPLNTPLTPAQAGLTAAQQAQQIAAVGSSAVSLIRTATGGPYTVAGTNLVYNPATGMLTTAAGANQVAAALSNSFGSLGSGLMSNLPLIGGALLVILVLPSLMGRK